MAPSHLLLEIGVEELPSSFVDAALAALPEIVGAKLAGVRLAHGEVKALGTPRRLAVLVRDVESHQSDLDEEVVGPPETAAFKDGKPTRAAEAFAGKLGVPLDSLVVADVSGGKAGSAKQPKPGRYVVGRRVEKGRAARELLGKALAEVCGGIPFRKSMRWGTLEATFGRPVQWLVALYGDEVVDVAFAGVRSGRSSRGHRFLAPEEFAVRGAEGYTEQLRAHHVIVDRDERKRVMLEKVLLAANGAGATYDADPSLVDENVSLVEEPYAITGSFDPAFLELPPAVIRAVARGHQKYFCVQRSEEVLLPHYVAVVNTANDAVRIAKGNDKAMRARLSDARFFYEEDRKAPPEERVGKLEGIVFHNKLGTVREKVARIEELATVLSTKLGLDADGKADALRAAHLCKFDLVSLMVGEFPELQGHMGRAYAKHAGERPAVAEAIRDHYRPLGAADSVARDDVSAVVALADRLDTLTGCFGIGLEPSGAADPFALRRACIAILRTLLDKGIANPHYARMSLRELVLATYDGYGRQGKKLGVERAATAERVEAFIGERLRGLLASATSTQVAEAVLAGYHEVEEGRASIPSYPVYALAKARALQAVVTEQQPWLGKAKTVAKRLHGISRESLPVLHPGSAFTRAEDANIVEVVLDADKVTRNLYDEVAIRRALASTEELAARIDDIFVKTLVNDPADPKTAERLELLSYGAACMLRIADFAKLG